MTNEERFIEGALNCLLWSEQDWGEENEDGSDQSLLDAGYTIEDIYLDDKSQFVDDCRRFLHAVHESGIEFTNYEQAGYDFTLSINGHGSGFFDLPDLYGGRENVRLLMACAMCIQSATPWTRGGTVHLGRRTWLVNL